MQTGKFPRRGVFIVIATSLLLADCAPRSPRFELEVETQTVAVSLGRSLIQTSPGGPIVVGVTETRYANALVQNVVLQTNAATPGQNEFIVRAYQAGSADENEPATLGDRGLSFYAISRELEERFPRVEMLVSQAYTQNKYGPFGYATGSPGNGDLCLYGWQRIERTNRPLFSRIGGAVSIRLRICERGRTEAELLQLFYGFTFVGYSQAYGWDPFGDPPGPPPELGATSSPIYPVAPSATYERTQAPPRRVIESVRRVPQRSLSPPVVEQNIESESLPGYPTVPPPSGMRGTENEQGR